MRLLLISTVLPGLLCGCTRVGFDPPFDRGPGVLDGLVDQGAEIAPTDLASEDLARDDSTPADIRRADTAAPCGPQLDSDTLLLFTFSGQGAKITDATGKHHGTLVGHGATRVKGRSGCGKALTLAGKASNYVLVDDAPDWDLAEGSMDMWLRIGSSSGYGRMGIVSRDATGSAQPGHITLFRLCDGGIAVRLQHGSNIRDVQCSKPVTTGWHHVGVNFGKGGLRLYVDGVAASRTDTILNCFTPFVCGTSTTLGIAGNGNPWVLGASSHRSKEGQATPTSDPFTGTIGSFRISKVRRNFRPLPP